MNLQSLIVVVLRLMALDFVLQVAIQTAPILLHFLHLNPPTDPSSYFPMLPWLLLIGLVIAAGVLWFLALPIARLVTRGVSHDISFRSQVGSVTGSSPY